MVLALLSFIAELKPDTVIFAMEEPEIALPPHTQKRIVNSVRERVRACVRNAREFLFFRREGRPGEFLQSASRVCLVRVLALPNSRHHGGQSPHTPGTGRTILRSKV